MSHGTCETIAMVCIMPLTILGNLKPDKILTLSQLKNMKLDQMNALLQHNACSMWSSMTFWDGKHPADRLGSNLSKLLT